MLYYLIKTFRARYLDTNLNGWNGKLEYIKIVYVEDILKLPVIQQTYEDNIYWKFN